jgi:hypothetical protein
VRGRRADERVDVVLGGLRHARSLSRSTSKAANFRASDH